MFITFSRGKRGNQLSTVLRNHFGKGNLASLSISKRQFPVRVRADLQRAVEVVFADSNDVQRFLSVRNQFDMAGVNFTDLVTENVRGMISLAAGI